MRGRAAERRFPAGRRLGRRLGPALAAVLLASTLAGCNTSMSVEDMFAGTPKAEKPVSSKLKAEMVRLDMDPAAPIMIRVFKDEMSLEVWKQTRKGTYAKLTEFEICKLAGKLGPKLFEGDRQAPEGFYPITRGQMNPNSQYHLAFNVGYPNAFDRAHGRTGSAIMVHGACSSAGCFSMTDERVEQIYALARDAFNGGQAAFQMQSFPFRMTPQNMAKNAGSEHFAFWKMLKQGYDHFDLTKRPPRVDVCEKRYVFSRQGAEPSAFSPAGPCPDTEMAQSLQVAYAARLKSEEKVFDQVLRAEAFKAALAGRKPEASTQLALAPDAAGSVADPAAAAVKDGGATARPAETPATPALPAVPPASMTADAKAPATPAPRPEAPAVAATQVASTTQHAEPGKPASPGGGEAGATTAAALKDSSAPKPEVAGEAAAPVTASAGLPAPAQPVAGPPAEPARPRSWLSRLLGRD